MPNYTSFTPDSTNFIENDHGDGNENSKPEDVKNMPSNQVLNTILNYSKALSIRKSEKNGFIENILN